MKGLPISGDSRERGHDVVVDEVTLNQTTNADPGGADERGVRVLRGFAVRDSLACSGTTVVDGTACAIDERGEGPVRFRDPLGRRSQCSKRVVDVRRGRTVRNRPGPECGATERSFSFFESAFTAESLEAGRHSR